MPSDHHITGPPNDVLADAISELARAIAGLVQSGNNQAVLDRIALMETRIMATQADIDAALQKIDAATNKLATNVQIIADTDQKISDEIDAFLKAVLVGTVLTDAQVQTLQSIGDRSQANSDASDAQVAVLQAIATKGAGNPVPVPVPTPPPTP